MLQELTEQVESIAARLVALRDEEEDSPDIVLPSDRIAYLDRPRAGPDRSDSRVTPKAKPPLPDPRLVRLIAKQRRLRSNAFDPQLFGEPAWDMLLDPPPRVASTSVSRCPRYAWRAVSRRPPPCAG
ncbi:hypothetical protein AEB_P0539 [Altererythrobacter sp. B11]|nr:hypothetical protein AEB_P0539 [Altererythrobacter sp. B11]